MTLHLFSAMSDKIDYVNLDKPRTTTPKDIPGLTLAKTLQDPLESFDDLCLVDL